MCGGGGGQFPPSRHQITLYPVLMRVYVNILTQVMGRQYATLKRLEEEHHVVVEVQKNNAEDGNPNGGEQSVVLIITGTTENCNAVQ